MVGEWRSRTLGDLCDAGIANLQTGPFGSQLHAHDYVESGVPVVPTEAIRDRRIDGSQLPTISARKAKELARHRLKSEDILFARRGVQATGHIGYVRTKEDGYICGTGAILLRISDPTSVCPAFLSHVLAAPASIAWFKFHAIGATMPNLNEGIIRSFPVRLPPVPEQRTIAGLLGTLDDKIELNRRMAETLEAMARALFKSWFVDFDPVRARADGRLTGLSDALAALFPDGFGEDEVPAGWRHASLGDLVTMERATIDPALLGDTPVAHFSLPAFDAGRRPVREPASGIKSLKLSLEPPLVLFAKLNPETPRIWPVLSPSEPVMLASTEFLAFKPRPGRASLTFVTSLLRSNAFREKAAGMVTGTSKSHQRVQPSSLLQTTWLVPSARILATFDEIVAPMLDRADTVRRESDTLAALRDALLPKLISGDLRVADAERAVAAA